MQNENAPVAGRLEWEINDLVVCGMAIAEILCQMQGITGGLEKLLQLPRQEDLIARLLKMSLDCQRMIAICDTAAGAEDVQSPFIEELSAVLVSLGDPL